MAQCYKFCEEVPDIWDVTEESGALVKVRENWNQCGQMDTQVYANIKEEKCKCWDWNIGTSRIKKR